MASFQFTSSDSPGSAMLMEMAPAIITSDPVRMSAFAEVLNP